MSVSIYLLRNKETGRVYVGSTRNHAGRKSQHFSKMRLSKHPNYHIQSDCDAYGLTSFEFVVVEDGISENDRFIREQSWIDKMREETSPIELYNMQPYAGKTSGRPVSDEVRAKMSASQKARERPDSDFDGIRRANIGRVFSPETRRKISEAHLRRPPAERRSNAILTEDQVVEIFKALQSGETWASLAGKYGVGTSTIGRIKHGITWRDVTDKLKEAC